MVLLIWIFLHNFQDYLWDGVCIFKLANNLKVFVQTPYCSWFAFSLHFLLWVEVHTVALYVTYVYTSLTYNFFCWIFVEYFWLLFPDSNESSGRRSSTLCCVLDIISFAIYHRSRGSFLTCLKYKIVEDIQFCFYEHIKIELKKQRKTIMLLF